MENNKTKNQDDEVTIREINPHTELNDLEKTAIISFKIEEALKKNDTQKIEELTKTQEFQLLNHKTKEYCHNYVNNNDLPRKVDDPNYIELPKKKTSLTDTIKIKISDLRAEIDKNNNIELPTLKKKKSLYDTVIIKLDNIINNNSSLKTYQQKKVTSIKELPHLSKKNILKPHQLLKLNNLKLNIESEDFGKYLYYLNKLALNLLSSNDSTPVRKYHNIKNKITNIDNISISKDNYLQYQKKLSEFAINKLYYKLAPKETKKYKLYKCSVILSSLIILLSSLAIVNWFIEGSKVSNLSHSLSNNTDIDLVNDGTLYNVDEPHSVLEEELSEETKDMYWRYLNTPLSSIDFTELKKQNNDTVGWLIVNNTNVNYPVVQTTNNDYYLTHAFDKSNNSAGWVYADYRNDFTSLSRNTVIYAHGRKDKVMFGSLIDTLDDSWYKNKDNQIIQLSTLRYNTMWQIISIYKIREETYYITTDFSSNSSFKLFADNMLSRSIYDFKVDVKEDDKLLTLSTCYNDSGIRLVIQAKLVKVQNR